MIRPLGSLFLIVPVLLAFLPVDELDAQTDTASSYFERYLAETQWQYQYTRHARSGLITHEAGTDYRYFIWFRYNNTWEDDVNGEKHAGRWSIDGITLSYSFRGTEHFTINKLNGQELILSFTGKQARDKSEMVFTRANPDRSPFVKPWNELPLVIVQDRNNQARQKTSWWWPGRKKKSVKPEETRTRISIELTGGGYYGGMDPVVRDFIWIQPDGTLIREYESLHNGPQKTIKSISRSEMEELAEWISAQRFFQMKTVYDCDSKACMDRKRIDPKPIPLRLAVTIGDQRKVVSVMIWGEDQTHTKYVPYPPALDQIVDAIQRMAHRLEGRKKRH